MTNSLQYTLYTDGSCSKNPGPGGWAYVIQTPDGEMVSGSGFEEHSTNNRMEMMAVIQGLKAIPIMAHVGLFSDSTYVIKGLSAWIHGWRKKAFKRDGKDMPNADLWKILDSQTRNYTMSYTHVRGHVGNVLNEQCDVLAKNAITNAVKERPEGTNLSPLAQSILKQVFELESNKNKILTALRQATEFLKNGG